MDDDERRHRTRAPLRIAVPSRGDSLLRHLTEVVGGPLGRHSAPGVVNPGFFTVERVLIVLTIIAGLLAVLVKMPCRINGWSAPGQYYMACYSDWPALFHARGLADGVFPFLTPGSQFEYPVLLGLVAGATALLVPHGFTHGALAYFDINATLVVVVWVITVIATARMTYRRPWDAAMVAIAPGIILAGTINWDMWAVMLAALGMLAFARSRPVTAGIFLGLGTAMKLYPVLIFGAILVLAIRTFRIRPLLVSAVAAAVTWLAVNVPFALLNFDSWRYFFTFSGERGAGFSSIWFAWNLTAQRVGLPQLGPDTINALVFPLFALACVGILILGLTAARRPRMAQLAFLIVAAFVLLNKVYSPQFVVWLIPLAALAYPRWRAFLVWQAFEALHWAAIWMYLAKDASGGATFENIDSQYYVWSVVAHMAATAYVMARVVRDIVKPDHDVVRRGHVDDPQGGPFDHAPDRLVLRPRSGEAAAVREQARHGEEVRHG